MISFKIALGYVLLLAASVKVSAFEADKCDVFVFRTQENALWHCGDKLPADIPAEWWTSKYCDHSMAEPNQWPFAWASNHPDDWCDFMISTVRRTNEDHYPLSPKIGINDTPGPNVWFFSTLVDWGCYVVEDGKTTESYLVNSRAGEHASTVNQQCSRTMNYFDYFSMSASIRNLQWSGHLTPTSYTPQRNRWDRCHYDGAIVAPNYVPELGVQYGECETGYVCELRYTDYAECMPDPHVDHECCVSWHNKCAKKGDCCAGSECNVDGYCDINEPQVYDPPPGTCEGRQQKEEKKLYNRCYDYQSGGQGDCAAGYNCIGNSWYADCQIDETVKTDCCKWKYDNSNPRPGDCCLGWYSHCHTTDINTGKCLESQCVPGREIGVDEWKESMLDVHDRICTEAPPLASFNEVVGQCTGAVCGVWGDPHIVTCDDLHYDCQAVGLFTLMSNHMFNIQGHFVHIDTPWGGASITNDLAIDFVKTPDVPTIQFSFPKFEKYTVNTEIFSQNQRKVGACPLYFYQDGEMIDISKVPDNGYLMGDANSDYSVKLYGWNQIDIKHKAGVDENGEPYYSTSVVWIDGSGPYTEWSCIITYFICLPGQDKALFEKDSVGLLGTPTGDTKDDWMGIDGQTLMLPDSNQEQAAFEYCVDNWCVSQESSILTYEDGSSYTHYKCGEEPFVPFDVTKCKDSDEIVAECADSPQPIACQIEKCIGNPETDDEITNVGNITTHNGDDDPTILVLPPDDDPNDEYGDCANLGSGLSKSTGASAYSLIFPAIDCIFSDDNAFSVGHDNSLSVLVGGDFTCKRGAGIEGRSVFLGDMTIEQKGCERLAATGHGSLIHPVDNTVCVEVGGSVSIDSTFDYSKFILYEYGNSMKTCHFAYAGGCTLNGAECPTSQTLLEEQYVYTNGDFVQKGDLDLKRWEDEITLLKQKTEYWKSLEPNGISEVADKILNLASDAGNSPVQIFEISTIDDNINYVVFHKGLVGKTIMIKVTGGGAFNSAMMCFHPSNANVGDEPICGRDTFPPAMTSSIVWLFTSNAHVEMTGYREFQGSIVKPYGDLTISVAGQSGRLIVGGDLIIDGEYTELHNYEFDPVSHPLPLGDSLEEICEIQEPVCVENYKVLTNDTACPSKPEGIVKLVKSSANLPEGEPVLYDIIIDPPANALSARTVKFKVDNPFANHTDIFVKHVKKVGNYGMDPVCDSMPYTPGCTPDAPLFEVGCHEYEGVDAFALVNIYFASNTDSVVMDIGSGGDVTVDKCCKPPTEYDVGYGVIEYTFEIQCTCPDGVAQS